MDEIKPYFTIFTPIYNGEKHLERVFKSILGQNFKDFEWIVVDDGSTDNTANLIENFIVENPQLTIVFIKQNNIGKHRTWNKAVDIASGILFVPADADDYFVPESLFFFHAKWSELTEETQSKLSGINVLCMDNDTNHIKGDQFPSDGYVSNNLELYYKLKIKGEKWGCVRVDLLKSRKFPIVKGSFYPESYLWLYFSKKFKVLCFNKPLRKYYTSPFGLTSMSSKKNINLNQLKINLHYDFWLLINFGFYIARFSFVELLRIFYQILNNIFLIFKIFFFNTKNRY